MKRKLLAVSAALALVALPGCIPMAKLVRELKTDPAAVSVSVTTIYGNIKLTRVGARTNEVVTVATDGTITIKSANAP